MLVVSKLVFGQSDNYPAMANDEAESVSMQHSTIRKTNAILIDEKDQA